MSKFSSRHLNILKALVPKFFSCNETMSDLDSCSCRIETTHLTDFGVLKTGFKLVND